MKNLSAVVVGCGDRAYGYCAIAKKLGLGLEIVACVDPDEDRLRLMRETFGVGASQCYPDMEAVLEQGRIADCVLNCTMDRIHKQTALPFLKQGYDMLLEKPIAANREDLREIAAAARQNGCKLLICHVLRYAPFYRKAKKLIESGEIGTVVHLETSERVGLAHTSVSYIRGKWSRESECGSSMLLAKCCHDLDILCWLNNAAVPVEADSFGGRDFMTPAYAPQDAGTRCLKDCTLIDSCPYSAKLLHLDHNFMPWYPWQCTGKNHWEITAEKKRDSLLGDNPHGACAYKTAADVVDHQTVLLRFSNGSTASHAMLTSCVRPGRTLYVQGTAGELEGFADGGALYMRKFDRATLSYTETKFEFSDNDGAQAGGHYGGDAALMQDFFDWMTGGAPSISCTAIEDSVHGHLCVFAADEARQNRRRVGIVRADLD